jgi:cob(I)alamin adenosyltransferase
LGAIAGFARSNSTEYADLISVVDWAGVGSVVVTGATVVVVVVVGVLDEPQAATASAIKAAVHTAVARRKTEGRSLVGTRRVYGPRPAMRRLLPSGHGSALRGCSVPAAVGALERSPVRCGAVSISTKRGDDGSTGLLYGGRVQKDSTRIEANGAIDEAQAALGLARAEVRGSELDDELVGLERGLWVLMAEVATAPRNRSKLTPGATLVTVEMVEALERRVHELEAAGAVPSEFVVPGQSRVAAALDVARTVVRRAERLAVSLRSDAQSQVVPYLNRLSDLCWLLARSQEQEHLAARGGRVRPRGARA